jgi:hypothetical protein
MPAPAAGAAADTPCGVRVGAGMAGDAVAVTFAAGLGGDALVLVAGLMVAPSG